MTAVLTRKDIIDYYLACNFQGATERNRCAKEITKFNKANKQDKITIREIVAYALPSFDAYLTTEYPNIQFSQNFRCPLTNVNEANSTGYLWRFFDQYCGKFHPKFIFLGQTYVYHSYGCLVTHPIDSFIKVEAYSVFSLLRE